VTTTENLPMSIAAPALPFVEIVAALFNGDGGFVDLRAQRGERCTLELYAVEDHAGIANFLDLFDDHNLYFGIAARHDRRGGGGADNLRSLGALFVDIDFAAVAEGDARARLAAFPLPPTLQIASGGGLHVYWALREALSFPEEDAAAGVWLRRLAATLGGDPSATDVARVLRVPGSTNAKYRPGRVVRIEAADFARRYNAGADFDELLVADPDPAAVSTRTPFHLPLDPPTPGQRHKTLFAFGRSLKAKGGTPAMVRSALSAYNREVCVPPKADADVDATVEKVFRARDRKTFTLPVAEVEEDPQPPPRVGRQDADADAEPIALATVLDLVAKAIANYIVLVPAQADAIALWTAGSYVIDVFDTAAYLHITAGAKRCGKSRLLELLRHLVRRPWLTQAATRAALVRKLHEDKSTLLHDEIDVAIGDGKSENATALIGILNAGFSRFLSATICVGEGQNIQTKDFTVFGLKALAGIGALPSTVADRSIEIRLRAKRRADKVARARDRDVRAALTPLRQQLESWGPSALKALDGARPALPDELDDRAQDIWEMLLAVADLAGGDWPARARQAAVTLSGARVAELDIAAQLLSDIRDVLPDIEVDDGLVQTILLLGALEKLEDRPWATWSRGETMSPHALATKLRAFDVRPVQVDRRNAQREGRQPRGYLKADLEGACDRYLPPLAGESEGREGREGLL
jgi:Protein of unknown function (DUF3631)/RepB DNA-primase from phage plasmid